MDSIRGGRHTLHYRFPQFLLICTLLVEIHSASFDYLGCFTRIPTLKQVRRVHELTVENCVSACIEELQEYAALETQICFCGNKLGELQEDAKCFPCSERQEEKCGGFETVAYYTTGVKAPDSDLKLLVKEVTNTSLTLMWEKPLDAFKKITQYSLEAEPIASYATNFPKKMTWSVQADRNEYQLSDLQPATSYNVTLLVLHGNDIEANVTTTVKTLVGIASPRPAEPEVLSESDSTKTIMIGGRDLIYHNNNGPISAWRIVVHIVEGDLYQNFDPEELRDYTKSQEDGLPYYIAGEVENRTKTFTVGDGKNYGGYLNPPLPLQKHIHISVGVVSTLDNVTTVVYSDTSHEQHNFNTGPTTEATTSHVEEQTGTNQTLVIILTAACIIFGLLLISSTAVYCFLRLRASRQRTQRLSDLHELTIQPHTERENNGYVGDLIGNFSDHLALLTDRLDTTQKLNRKNLTLDIDHILANGNYGDVIKAHVNVHDISTLCQVHIVSDDMDKVDQQAFLKELTDLLEIDGHEAFVHFFGVCKTPDWVYLVFEQVPKTLKSFLLEARTHTLNKFSSVSEEFVMTMISDLCSAMEYLENNKIVHKKLNTFNIRMNQDEVAKIKFFGPTHLDEGKTVDVTRWQAPEVLKSQFNHSTKSDVWSFGILMWECCTLGATPYGNVASGDLLPRIRNGARPEQVPFIYDDFYQLFLNCWELDASERPTFEEISNYIRQLMTSIQHSLSFENRDGVVLPYHLPLLEIKN